MTNIPSFHEIYVDGHVSIDNARAVLIICYARFAASALRKPFLDDVEDEQLLDLLGDIEECASTVIADQTLRGLWSICYVRMCKMLRAADEDDDYPSFWQIDSVADDSLMRALKDVKDGCLQPRWLI